MAARDEKEEVSLFERILFALFPFLIVAVLILLLLTLLNQEFRSKAIEVARDIPGISAIIPDSVGALTEDGDIKAEKLTTRILELESQLAEATVLLEQAQSVGTEQASVIDTLSQEKVSLETVVSEVKVTDEEYTNNIIELANMFAKMSASKAAPIIEALTIEEMALILSHMKTANQVSLMEKMTPLVAANVAMKLKDKDVAANLEIAALQSKITELENSTPEESTSTTVTDEELAQSLSAMNANSAASLLNNMMEISSSKVLRVLTEMNNDDRSSILEAYAKLDAEEAALIASRLID